MPEVGAGEILVRVQTALTCGTDVKVFRRGYHARMIVPPALFGHELAGDVAQVGAGVTGSVSASEWWRRIPLLVECFFCRRGQLNLCEDFVQQRRLC